MSCPQTFPTPAAWQQLVVTAAQPLAESIASFLEGHGASAVTFQDNKDCAQFEETLGEVLLWPETKIIGLFAVEQDLQSLIELLQQQSALPTQQIYSMKTERVEEKDWLNVWKENYHAASFGKKLWVYPSWLAVAPQHQAHTVTLDPGMAFGTGTHPTTKLMLEWLDSEELSNKSVIDYGCGSGILALAAAKLGAKQVTAIDNDHNAISTTLQNAQLNKLATDLLYAMLDTEVEDLTAADVVLANILANPLVKLAPKLSALTKTGGKIVLSGLLAEQLELIHAAYAPWFVFEPATEQQGWIRLLGIKCQ